MEKVTKEVWFDLTETEIVDRAKTAAQVRNEIANIEYQAKEDAKAAKKAAEKKEVELNDLMGQIRTGKECRMLPCEVEKDYGTKTIKYKFEGKLVDERPMSPEERQLQFDVIEGGQRNNTF